MTAPAHLRVPGLPSDQENQEDPGSLEGGTDKVKRRGGQLGPSSPAATLFSRTSRVTFLSSST